MIENFTRFMRPTQRKYAYEINYHMIESFNNDIDREDIADLYKSIADFYKEREERASARREKKQEAEEKLPSPEKKVDYDTRNILRHINIDLGLSKYLASGITRIGFNNFKPFGEKHQIFEKKPITLIYGPNSIGKSSTINALLYLQYFQKKDNYSLQSTNLFGDTLDLGGFQKFIHQRDTSKTISFMVEVDDCRSVLLESAGLDELEANLLGYLFNFSITPQTVIKMHFFSKVIFLQATENYNSCLKDNKFSSKVWDKLFQKEIGVLLDGIHSVHSGRNMFVHNPRHISVKLNQILGTILKHYLVKWIGETNRNQKLNESQQGKLYNLILENKNNIFSNENENNIFSIEKITQDIYTYIQNKLIPEYFEKEQIKLCATQKQLNIIYKFSKNEIIKEYYIDKKLLFSSTKPNKHENEDEDEASDINDTPDYDHYHIERNENNILLKLLSKSNDFWILEELEKISTMKQVQYIGPLRFYPERDFTFREADNDKDIMPNSQEAWTLLKNDEVLIKKINKWLVEDSKLKTPYEIKYRKLYDIESVLSTNNLDSIDSFELIYRLKQESDIKEEMVFEDKRSNTQVGNRDLGLGISQILPILISTNRNRNKTIAIEQPELHLHPAVQCQIADELIRSHKENNNEFLIETHSEHLLLRIMKRLRHTAENKEGRDKTLDLTPDDVCLLYVDSDGESTYIKELRLSKKGKLLDHWPGGFFEEGYKERFL